MKNLISRVAVVNLSTDDKLVDNLYYDLTTRENRLEFKLAMVRKLKEELENNRAKLPEPLPWDVEQGMGSLLASKGGKS